jgi:hypothetical protein
VIPERALIVKDRAHPGDVNLGQRVLDKVKRLLHQHCQLARTSAGAS